MIGLFWNFYELPLLLFFFFFHLHLIFYRIFFYVI